MPKAETYDDLIFQLGDLARERLGRKPNAPRTMERVLRAEEMVLTRRDELADLEAQMNDEDLRRQELVDRCAADREELGKVVKQWKRVVDAIQVKVKDVRKRLLGRRAELRYGHANLKKEEAKAADLELTGADQKKLDFAKQGLKRIRLAQMRLHREVEELEAEVEGLFTVRDGQPGAEGILAHKRILELEDEEQADLERFEAKMAELDRLIGDKEEELRAAEQFLDQAVFLLGEECYEKRIADPMLAALYPRLDRAQ
jgi:hypothetical protein